ncbi:MAG: methyl-accepting chemotaxis protein [Peptococcaceae bacterium]|jgi:methyl-accepting chemotaxis protein|nr:methyl-accepting chemotaxis protein [Peptococcaceae bacterium]
MKMTKRMLLILLIPMVAIITVMNIYTYLASVSALREKIWSEARYAIGFYAKTIEEVLASQSLVITNLAAMFGNENLGRQEMLDMMGVVQTADRDRPVLGVGLVTKEYFSVDGWVPPEGYDCTTRPWYVAAQAVDAVIYAEPYIDLDTGTLITSISKRIMRNGALYGVVSMDVTLDEFKKTGASIQMGQSGYAYVLDASGRFIYHPQYTIDDNIYQVEKGQLREEAELFFNGETNVEESTFAGVEKLYASTPIGDTGWILVIGTPQSEIYEDVTLMSRVSLVGEILAVMILGGIIFFSTVKITKPIVRLAEYTVKMAEGDLSFDTENLVKTASDDEIGLLSKGFGSMRNQMLRIIKNVASSTEQVLAASEELSASAEESAQGAERVAGAIADVAQGAEKQLEHVSDTSDFVNDISSHIGYVADNTRKVSEQSAQAVDTAEEGVKSAEKAVVQMTSIEETTRELAGVVKILGERSYEIGKIVGTISGIAEQTNLLALNATIEAARAGEGGKGFAVVAEEVKKLAAESRTAAKQISELIKDIQDDTGRVVGSMENGTQKIENGTKAVAEAGVAFHKIVELITSVSGQINGISGSMTEMADGSRKITESMGEIKELSKNTSEHTESVAEITHQQTVSMQEIAEASRHLAQTAEELQSTVNEEFRF